MIYVFELFIANIGLFFGLFKKIFSNFTVRINKLNIHKTNKMKKSTLLVAALAMFAISANAQTNSASDNEKKWAIIPKVGINATTITSNPSLTLIETQVVTRSDGDPEYKLFIQTLNNAKLKPGLTLGAEFRHNPSNKFGMQYGILFSQEGARMKGTLQGVCIKYTKLSCNLNYINLPILANFRFADKLSVMAGIQPKVRIGTKAKGDKELIKSETPAEQIIKNDQSLDFDNGYPAELSVPMGLSYETGKLVIDLRYNISLLSLEGSILEGWDGGTPKMSDLSRNMGLSLMLGWRL